MSVGIEMGTHRLLLWEYT